MMMAAPSISNATIARAAQLVGFAVVAAALAVVSWRGTSLNLPDVGQFAGVVGSGFLGGIINPLMKTLEGSGGGAGQPAGGSQAASQQGSQVTSQETSQVTKTVEAAQDSAAASLGQKSDLLWEAAVAIGAVAIVVSALALAINGEHHVNAAAALTALATAFGALFVDTTKITHPVGASQGS
ncbi:hypothetical protein ABIA31_000273 [Catenulispora sp. MAP5-51]|uniref:hypothetical protein n=1 Tax=Catenulispora sp. MAP5-51 TaxID=3156298 RepID=UPI003513F7B2